MSFSISDIMKSISKNEDMPTPTDQLKNPDLPVISDKFDEKEEIRDKALSAFKLSSQPRSGNYFMLPRTRFDDNPRKDAFLMDGAIDPNVIRKRVNPDASIPSLEGGEYALYSLVPENNISTNSVGLVRQAHASYVNYKNRFFVEDKKSKPQNVVSTINEVIKLSTQPAIPTILKPESRIPINIIKPPLPRTIIKPVQPTIITYNPTILADEPLRTGPSIYKGSWENRNKPNTYIPPPSQRIGNYGN